MSTNAASVTSINTTMIPITVITSHIVAPMGTIQVHTIKMASGTTMARSRGTTTRITNREAKITTESTPAIIMATMTTMRIAGTVVGLEINVTNRTETTVKRLVLNPRDHSHHVRCAESTMVTVARDLVLAMATDGSKEMRYAHRRDAGMTHVDRRGRSPAIRAATTRLRETTRRLC